MNRKRNISYIKPEDPEFLKVFKRQAGYDERNHKFDILENREEDFQDDQESEQPQVVVLESGDLTAEQVEVEKQRIESEEKIKKADLSQKIYFKPKPVTTSDKKSKNEKKNKSSKSKPILSFADDEEGD